MSSWSSALMVFYIVLMPSPPWKLVSNKHQCLMSLMCLHRTQQLPKVRVGWQTSAEVFDAHRSWECPAQLRAKVLILPSSHQGLSQDHLLLPNSESSNNAGSSALIFTALEEAFGVNLRLGAMEQLFISALILIKQAPVGKQLYTKEKYMEHRSWQQHVALCPWYKLTNDILARCLHMF